MDSYNNYRTKRKIATFIDSENVNKLEIIPELLKYLDHEGFIPSPKKIIVSKITQPEEYTRIIKEYCFEIVVSYKLLKKGKAKKVKEANHNNADFRYYIEVLDCFYKEKDIDAFCIVASDDDYTELILKLKSEGKFLIGVGFKENTSPKFRALFDEFFSVEDFLSQNKANNQSEETTNDDIIDKKKLEEEEANNDAVIDKQNTKESIEKDVKKSPKKSKKIKKDKSSSNDKEKENQTKETNEKENQKDVKKALMDEFLDHAKKYISTLGPGKYNLSNITSIIKKTYPNRFNMRVSFNKYELIGFKVYIDDNDKSNAYIIKE